MRVFVSYAREDEGMARRIFEYLSQIEEIFPWLDREKIQPGILWEEAI